MSDPPTNAPPTNAPPTNDRLADDRLPDHPPTSDRPALRLAPPPFLAEPAFAALLAALPDARVVGGAVRDALADRPIADIDLATKLPPTEVMAALQRAGIRAVPTGLAHGTVTAVLDAPRFPLGFPPGFPPGGPLDGPWAADAAWRSPRCAATWRPTGGTRPSPSPMTGARTRHGATSPSTRCR
jgi:hypothetical protein